MKQSALKFNELDTAILSCLTSTLDSGISGYDITTKNIANTRAWSAAHQQVYRELNKMSKAGIVTHNIIPQDGKPDKKIYTITDKGLELFNDHVATATAKPEKSHNHHTVMLLAGSEHYFESLIAITQMQMDALDDVRKELNSDMEILLVDREQEQCIIDMNFAINALTLIRKNKEKQNDA